MIEVDTPLKASGARAAEWILGPDTGLSSRTIWGVLVGAEAIDRPDIPYDPSDFGRCYRLLEVIPEWRSRLSEVADRFPAWRMFIAQWEAMELLWKEESPSGNCPRLYALMQEIRAK